VFYITVFIKPNMQTVMNDANAPKAITPDIFVSLHFSLNKNSMKFSGHISLIFARQLKLPRVLDIRL